MCCTPRLERCLRGGDAEVTVVNPENYMLYTPLPPGRRRAWSNPATWCRCGRCCAPRQRAATVTSLALDLRTCTYRRPSGDEQVLSWDRLVVAPGSVSRLVPVPAWPSTPADAANLGRRLRVGLDWAVAIAMPAPSSNSARSAARGRWLPRARGASRAYRSAADAGRPPPPLGPGRSVTGADQVTTVEEQRPVVGAGRDPQEGSAAAGDAGAVTGWVVSRK